MFVCERCGREFRPTNSLPVRCTCPVVAVPVSAWPRWALTLKRLRTANDTGVGDTAQRIAAKFGGERYKRLTKRLGMPCGCSERQAEWNRLYPYGD